MYSGLFACQTSPPKDLHDIDYSKVTQNRACQLMCRGCEEIQTLIIKKRINPQASAEAPGPPKKIHSGFLELEKCAQKCVACQVIRRALLLKQITKYDANLLRSEKGQRDIFVTLSGEGSLRLVISLDDSRSPSMTAEVICNPTNTISTSVRPEDVSTLPDFSLLKKWVNDCHQSHHCSKYRRSSKNPSWLLQILPGNKAKVINASEKEPVEYIVLSYSWGNPESPTMSREEWKRIKNAATRRTKENEIVPERVHPFMRTELPETMQDAISLAEKLDIQYIWIDSICIPKGSDWDLEASRMHEVYGNAHFTLSACSSRRATDRLIVDRDAWLYPRRGCKIDSLWLSTSSNTLDDVRLRAPISDRGWVLQEERLSPRILYWSSQEAYWSCAEAQNVEPSRDRDWPIQGPKYWSPPYRFLQLCREGDIEGLQEEWLDLVESYTRRGLAKGKDRFIALAGLATCYYEALSNPGANNGEEYLAGLWKGAFARQLTWSVTRAKPPEQHLLSIAPPWSWVSLPLQTEVRAKHDFVQAQHFALVARQRKTNRSATSVVSKGSLVKFVEVFGRFRPFLDPDAQDVPWSSIAGKTSFDFARTPERSSYSRNLEDGRIVSYEAHKEEVIGQLDYLAPEPETGSEVLTGDSLEAGVILGTEKGIVCLEVGESALLLLEPVQRSQEGPDSFRRVGVCLGYRKGFFKGFEARHIRLC